MEEKETAQLPVSEQEIQIQPPSPLDKLKIHKFKILGGVLGILILAGAVFGAYKFGQRQVQPSPQPTPAPGVVATPTPDPTANWETYMNTTLGYSVKYPSGWEVKILKNAVSIVDPCGKQVCDSVWISNTVDQNDPAFKEAKQKRSVKVRELETYQTVRPSSDGLATLKYFYFEKDEEWWLIQFTQTNEKAGITFNLMLSTFRFLGEAEGWETYTSSQYSFSFKYPTDWDVRDLLSVNKTLPGRENTLVFIGFGPKHTREDVYGMIEITKNDLDYEIAQFKKSFETAGIPTIIKQENTIDISGKTGKEIITQNTLNKVESKNWFVSYKGLSYKISGGGTQDNSIVYKLLSTFRFLE